MLLIQQFAGNLSQAEILGVIVMAIVALVVMWPKRKR